MEPFFLCSIVSLPHILDCPSCNVKPNFQLLYGLLVLLRLDLEETFLLLEDFLHLSTYIVKLLHSCLLVRQSGLQRYNLYGNVSFKVCSSRFIWISYSNYICLTSPFIRRHSQGLPGTDSDCVLLFIDVSDSSILVRLGDETLSSVLSSNFEDM